MKKHTLLTLMHVLILLLAFADALFADVGGVILSVFGGELTTLAFASSEVSRRVWILLLFNSIMLVFSVLSFFALKKQKENMFRSCSFLSASMLALLGIYHMLAGLLQFSGKWMAIFSVSGLLYLVIALVFVRLSRSVMGIAPKPMRA